MEGKMNTLTKIAAGAVISLGLMSPAMAQDRIETDTGTYMFGALGGHWSHESELEGGGVDIDLEHEVGPGGLVGLGYDFSEWRAELEGGYRQNDIEGNGDTQIKSIMANIFYDFGMEGRSWEPYAGVGMGLGRVTLDGVAAGGATVNDDDTGPAFQIGAGAAFPLDDQVDLTVDYRFLTVQGLGYRSSNGTTLESDVYDHAIFVGLRFDLFSAPKPMPAAAPEPPAEPQTFQPRVREQVREFQVFFDWDQATITPEARAILEEAATEAKRIGAVRIVATGHADRSGPSAYNERLSQRRADNVRSELVSLGIAGSEIATFAKGETDPLVATADGVREPRNRRVQVVLE